MKLRKLIVALLAVVTVLAQTPVSALAQMSEALPHTLAPSAVACTVSSSTTPAINNKSYASLEEAFADIEYDTSQVDGYGNTIKTPRPEGTKATVMLASRATVPLSNHIDVIHDVTLDLNGGTIMIDFVSTTDPAYMSDRTFAMGFLVSGGSTNHGLFTVKDSSSVKTGRMVVRGAGEAIRCQGGGAVTIESGTYEIPADGEGRYCIECLGGHVTINGGTFTNSRTNQPSASVAYGMGTVINGAQTGASAGRTTINGGTFSSMSAAFYCMVNFAGVLEIASVSSANPTLVEGSAGAVAFRGGTNTVKGGSFRGVTSVIYAADDSYYQGEFDQKEFDSLTISDGTFTNTGGGTSLLVGVNGSGKDEVNVTGGTFSGDILLSPAARACKLLVSGGTFTDLERLTPRLAPGYMTKDNENSTYTVVPDPNYVPDEDDDPTSATITSDMVGIGNVSVVTYTGSSIEPEVAVVNGDTTLKEGEDYAVSYEDNVNVGRATVLVEGINAWKGEVRKYFTITERSIIGNTLTFSQNPCAFVEGVDPDPGAGVVMSDGTVLEKDRDFTVSYTINEVVGNGTATVRAKGNYTGSLVGNFNLQRGYRVTFVDGVDQSTIAEKVALYGGTVEAPTPPLHEGYVFDAWEGDYSRVMGDTRVTARYAASTSHVVTFVDGVNNEVISTVRVEDGEAATAPVPPRHTGYTFVSWDKAFDSVRSDLTVTATYVRAGVSDVTEIPPSMLDNARGTVQERTDGSLLVILTDANGKFSSGWRIVGGSWYYAGKDGVALSGRVDDAGKTYYFGSDCKMRTGWIWDSAANGWAWAEPSEGPYQGVVAKNCWVWAGDGWYLAGPNGIMRVGWAWVGDTCYHLNTGANGGTMGRMDTGWVFDNLWFWCDASGAMQANRWICVNDVWYLLGGDGAMLKGWQWRNGVWYYLRDSGAMATGWQWIDDAWYYFWSDGRMLYSTITPDGYWVAADGKIRW